MKKIVLSAAIVCACIGSAFAQNTFSGNYSIQIGDFITLTPNGVQGGIQTVNFANPTDQSNGLPINAIAFTVQASRSWKATHAATDFLRTTTSTNPAISNTAPANIMRIWVNNLTSATTSPRASVTPGDPATNAAQVIAANATGGLSQGFTLNGRITPGFTTNLSGQYTNTISIIAALD